jgi:hypothetical protein
MIEDHVVCVFFRYDENKNDTKYVFTQISTHLETDGRGSAVDDDIAKGNAR